MVDLKASWPVGGGRACSANMWKVGLEKMMNNQPGLLQKAENCIEFVQLVSIPEI